MFKRRDMKMGIKELMSHVDHTLLAQTATWGGDPADL